MTCLPPPISSVMSLGGNGPYLRSNMIAGLITEHVCPCRAIAQTNCFTKGAMFGRLCVGYPAINAMFILSLSYETETVSLSTRITCARVLDGAGHNVNPGMGFFLTHCFFKNFPHMRTSRLCSASDLQCQTADSAENASRRKTMGQDYVAGSKCLIFEQALI